MSHFVTKTNDPRHCSHERPLFERTTGQNQFLGINRRLRRGPLLDKKRPASDALIIARRPVGHPLQIDPRHCQRLLATTMEADYQYSSEQNQRGSAGSKGDTPG
jgi:hypothetical protein